MFASAYFPERASGVQFTWRSLSSPTPDPDDDSPLILFSLPTVGRPHLRLIHTLPSQQARHLVQISDSCHRFGTMRCLLALTFLMSQAQDIGPRHILSAADTLKFENMILDCEKQNGSVRSRGSSITSPAPPSHPVYIAHDPASPVIYSNRFFAFRIATVLLSWDGE